MYNTDIKNKVVHFDSAFISKWNFTPQLSRSHAAEFLAFEGPRQGEVRQPIPNIRSCRNIKWFGDSGLLS